MGGDSDQHFLKRGDFIKKVEDPCSKPFFGHAPPNHFKNSDVSYLVIHSCKSRKTFGWQFSLSRTGEDKKKSELLNCLISLFLPQKTSENYKKSVATLKLRTTSLKRSLRAFRCFFADYKFRLRSNARPYIYI